MHILPLLMLTLLLLSCTADKKGRKQADQVDTPTPPTYMPTQKGSPNTSRQGDKRTSNKESDGTKQEETVQGKGKEHTKNEDTGKVTAQDEGKVGKETAQDEGKGGKETEEGKEPEKIVAPEPEVLSVKLSFAVDNDVLYPLLEFSEQYLVEISDVELRHVGQVTLKLEDEAYTFENKGIKIPPMEFVLKLKWRDKTCHERIEVKDMMQTTEVLCQ